jgi:hypothetical protein
VVSPKLFALAGARLMNAKKPRASRSLASSFR